MIRRAVHVAAASLLCTAYWVGFCLLAPLFFGGCVYKGAKVTEGTDLTIGVSIPGTEGMAEAAVVNWLSGFRLAIAEGAELDMKYTVAETNSYFGCVETRIYKHIDAKVTPVDFDAEDGDGDAGKSE